MNPKEVHPFIYTKDKIIFEAYKREADLLRLQTFYTVLPHLDTKKNNLRTPSDLFPYMWDRKKKVVLNVEDYTEDKFKELDRKYSKKSS